MIYEIDITEAGEMSLNEKYYVPPGAAGMLLELPNKTEVFITDNFVEKRKNFLDEWNKTEAAQK